MLELIFIFFDSIGLQERIRVGREMQEARRMEEQQERQR